MKKSNIYLAAVLVPCLMLGNASYASSDKEEDIEFLFQKEDVIFTAASNILNRSIECSAFYSSYSDNQSAKKLYREVGHVSFMLANMLMLTPEEYNDRISDITARVENEMEADNQSEVVLRYEENCKRLADDFGSELEREIRKVGGEN